MNKIIERDITYYILIKIRKLIEKKSYNRQERSETKRNLQNV